MTTRSRPRLSKYGREVAPIAERCGYEFDRQAGGHYVFTQPGFDNFVIPSTPSDSRAFANDIARLKRLHPEQFERAKSANRPTKDQRRERANRRHARASIALLTPAGNGNGATPTEQREIVPRPGSPEAVAAGCICPAYRNNQGRGVTGKPGVFAYAIGKYPCLLHLAESQQQQRPARPTDAEQILRCKCGNQIPQRKTGRPRKWCFSCRPSRWDHMTDDQRDRQREQVRRWYTTQTQEAA